MAWGTNEAETTIETVEKRFQVKAPFKFLSVLKSVTGAKWNPECKAWTYPVDPFVAHELFQRFPHAKTDDAYQSCLAEYAKQGEKQAVKTAAELPDIPVTKLPPWLHQKQAFHFASQFPAAMLAMDMGTGKSKVTIDLIQNRGHKLVLILCPQKVVDVWPLQFATHCAVPYECIALKYGTIIKRTDAAKLRVGLRSSYPDRVFAVVINYEAAYREPFATWALKQPWDAVICDESHKLKAPGGAASRFVGNLGKRATHRYCLTGTPLPHSPLDAYAQYRFLDPSIYGTSFQRFKMRYAITGGFGGYEILGWQNEEEYNERFYRIAYKVGKEVLDLPEFHHINRYTQLSAPAAKMYGDMASDFVAWLDGTAPDGTAVTAANALVKLLRFQQLTSGFLVDPEGKMRIVDENKAELFEECLDELATGEPVVVFCRFRQDLDIVKAMAAKQERMCFEISGRADELAAWKSVSGGVLAVQIQAGGVGIDLTKARYAIYYSTGFSLGDYEQSLARIHRPGQTQPTTYIHLLCRNTVDEKVQNALAERKQVVEAILRDMGRQP